jgi:hypothetical protein
MHHAWRHGDTVLLVVLPIQKRSRMNLGREFVWTSCIPESGSQLLVVLLQFALVIFVASS